MALEKIKFKRGLEADLPTFDIAEPGFVLDTNQFFIGGIYGNIEFPTKEYTDLLVASSLLYNNTISGLTASTIKLAIDELASTKVNHIDGYNEAETIKVMTTENRPTEVPIGYMYFDSTLGKPIWLKDIDIWVDAMGIPI